MATSDSPLSVPDITLEVARQAGDGGPDPTGPFTISSITAEGEALTISGSGFGTKSQPTEILYDGGDFVRENGVENSYRAGLTDGAVIETSGTVAEEVWKGGAGGSVQLKKTGLRAAGSTAKLSVIPTQTDVGDIWFGFPKAEIPGGDIPYHTKYHARWFIKWRYGFSKLKTLRNWTVTSGSFIYPDLTTDPEAVGEELIMGDTGIIGYLLRHDGEKTSVYTPDNTDQFEVPNDTVITGVTSGATATISRVGITNSAVGTDNYGVEKVFRAWSRQNGSGSRFTIEQYKMGFSGASDNFPDVSAAYENEWVALDVVVDLEQNIAKFYANGALWGQMTGMDEDKDFGLATAAIGWQDVRGIYNFIEFADIYTDHDLRCVYLGNAELWGDCTVTEIQPVSWTGDSEIKVPTMRTGAIDTQAPVYTFVTYKGVPDPSDVGVVTDLGGV